VSAEQQAGATKDAPDAEMSARELQADLHTPPARAWHAIRQTLGRLPRLEMQLLIGLLLIYLAFSIAEPEIFPTDRTFENLARQWGILLVVGVGQMLVLVVGGFDISVGANVGFTSTALALLIDDVGVTTAVAAAIALGGAVGLGNGLIVARLGVNPFVTTLAMLTFLTGLSNELSNGASVPISDPGIRPYGATDWGPIPATAGISLIVLALAYVLLNRLRPGLYIYAIGGSRETARLSGIAVARYEVLAYTVCGLFAGVGGVMLASRVSVGQASLGAGLELQSIAAAVIGGAAIGGGHGRLLGVALGVAILTVLTSGLEIVGVSEFTRNMVTGAVLVAAVVFNQRRRVGWRALGHGVLSQLRRLDGFARPRRRGQSQDE
jgi:ribose/xylose/arabinose/galactoside ABC-type transport system permease subunit